MSVRCVERDLWDAVLFFFLLLQRGRVEVIEEIKETRREGGAQSGGSYICVRNPSFLNIFSPGHFDNLEGKRAHFSAQIEHFFLFSIFSLQARDTYTHSTSHRPISGDILTASRSFSLCQLKISISSCFS